MPGGLFVLQSVVEFQLIQLSVSRLQQKLLTIELEGNSVAIGQISELAIFTLPASAFRIEDKPT